MFQQAGTQLFAQIGGGERDVRLWDQVSHQTLITVFLCTGDHHRFPDAFTANQPVFNFAQFNAETAYLDLKIVAAKVVDIAVGQPAAEVAGLVQAGIGRG
ncbi:hypothetical protein Xkoz_03650 [Xenorhabdus kozodoii]|uniref:Uncharacterized protein n=1 Tax=Xenorhabdus kozodoii TaxID=351676 RepID=A0A2D0KZ19_9GAMM|nr:hypothetical protein Xkoz_03650 [Xenorhabdus kozodoii]